MVKLRILGAHFPRDERRPSQAVERAQQTQQKLIWNADRGGGRDRSALVGSATWPEFIAKGTTDRRKTHTRRFDLRRHRMRKALTLKRFEYLCDSGPGTKQITPPNRNITSCPVIAVRAAEMHSLSAPISSIYCTRTRNGAKGKERTRETQTTTANVTLSNGENGNEWICGARYVPIRRYNLIYLRFK